MKKLAEILPYLIVIFIGNMNYNFSFQKINNKKININIKTMITILLIALLIYVCNIFQNIIIRFFLISIVMYINFKVLYKLNSKKTIISYILIYITIMLIEISITNLLSIIGILNSSEKLKDLTYQKIIMSLVIIIPNYIIISIPIINKILKKILYFFETNSDVSNILYIIFITMTIIGILNLDNYATDNSVRLIIILVIIFAILFFMIIKAKTKEEFLEESNKRLIEYNEKYGQFLDEYKIYKHNIKNKLIGMKVYGNKKIKALIDDLLEEETTFSIKNNNLYNLPQGIKGIVAEKLYNIKINVIIENKLKNDPFIKLNPKEFNSISESIGICLDNAIEASIETENPIITLELYENKKNIYIKIGNNYTNNIDIDELGDKYYSTKNRGSGLGLFSLHRNNLIEEKISLINDFYYIELKIKKHAFK